MPAFAAFAATPAWQRFGMRGPAISASATPSAALSSSISINSLDEGSAGHERPLPSRRELLAQRARGLYGAARQLFGGLLFFFSAYPTTILSCRRSMLILGQAKPEPFLSSEW